MTDRPQPLQTVDLMPDQLALARAQLGSGLYGLAEGVLLRLIGGLEAAGRGGLEELDAARSLLAEALWRQGRPVAAGAVMDAIRARSLEHQRPLMVPDRRREHRLQPATPIKLRGSPSRWWRRSGRTKPGGCVPGCHRASPGPPHPRSEPTPANPASRPAAHRRTAWSRPRSGGVRHPRDQPIRPMPSSRAGSRDRQLGAVRLDPRLASDGIALLEPTLEPEPAADRLLLYGDLLRAAGREADAETAFDRAARPGPEPTLKEPQP